MRLSGLAAAALLFAAPWAPAHAQQVLIDRCVAETCVARLTPHQLLAEAEKLVVAGRVDEARPMLEALAQVPQLALETRYLSGLSASKQGDHEGAARFYQAILDEHPDETRVRLELARELLAMGHNASADRQFAIAEQDQDLPPDVARTIRSVRDIIRRNRPWRFDVDFALVPDSNINNATGNDTVTILWGDTPIPLELDEQARARSGTGQSATISAGVRLPVAQDVAMLVDLDSAGTNFAGSDYDDYLVQVAAGPEVRLSPSTSLSVEAVGAQRWFGGNLVSRQGGVKAGLQSTLSPDDRIGVQVDARRTDARFDDNYSGWQTGAYATYERAVARSIVVSGGGFARRDWLNSGALSSTELGVIAGVGGELPLGITFGVSGTVSRANYDAPYQLFSLEPRQDTRFSIRATLGNRKVSVLGFSPQLGLTYNRNDSTIDYFTSDRLRLRIGVARYF